MEDQKDNLALAKSIIDANLYMTLATADATGHPWASPVWFAHDEHTDFLWVSRPEARHTRNIGDRSELGIVIFDSTVPVGSAQAVYIDAVAKELDGDDRERAIAIYSRRAEACGAGVWGLSDVTAPAEFRLYRARALQLSVLTKGSRRADLRLPPPGAS